MLIGLQLRRVIERGPHGPLPPMEQMGVDRGRLRSLCPNFTSPYERGGQERGKSQKKKIQAAPYSCGPLQGHCHRRERA